MSFENQERPATPQLRQLQLPEQGRIRTFLRAAGPIVLAVGGICSIVGFGSFFISFGGFQPSHYFWLCFIGLPMMALGLALTKFGYLGSAARYVAGETAPVLADTVKYVAEETKGAVETVARSAAKGVAEGMEAGRSGASAGFCPYCGGSVKVEFQFCPKCGKLLSAI